MFLAVLVQLLNSVSKEVIAHYTIHTANVFIFLLYLHDSLPLCFCCISAFFLSALTKDRKVSWALSFFYILSNKARLFLKRCFICMGFINTLETL